MARNPQTEKEGRLFAPASPDDFDPLRCDVDLPLSGTFYPLGFTVEIATNSSEVLSAAEESWKHFYKRYSETPIQLRIGVVEGKSKICPPPPNVAGQRDLVMHIADSENFAVSDARGSFAYGWLSQAAVATRAYLRYYFLEGVFWVIAVPRYLTPIHAASVSYRGSGVLLCGNSGVGKSSLAYACARSGWTFLSDDSSHLIRNRDGRVVIGNPFQMRFRPSATKLFPELCDQRVNPRVTGKLSIELVTSDFPQIARTFENSVDFIVFLNRRTGPSGLFRCSKNDVLKWFESAICYGSPSVRTEQRASLQKLLSAEIFELRYTDLDDAVAQLESMVQAGGSASPELAVIEEGQ